MAQPQHQEAEAEAEASPQVTTGMDPPDLTCVMDCLLLLKISSNMDTAGRSSWRLVSKAARQAVYDSTTALAPSSKHKPTITSLLPQLLEKCSSLKQLSCSGLPYLSTITRRLQLPMGLEALDISHTDARDLSFVARCPSLRHLAASNVRGCRSPHSRQLAPLLQELPGLTALDLHNNPLGVDAAHDVAAALATITALQELGLGEIDQQAAAALLPAVPHLKQLRTLHLTDCGLGGQALLPALLPLTHLQQLDLEGNGLGPGCALLLAPAVSQLRQLQHLELGDNELGDEGVSALAPAIQQLTRLTSLNLGLNGFSLAGAQALAPALQGLTGLQVLGLCSNGIGPEGAALLSPALQQLTQLQRLNLSSMGLGPEGVTALAPALQRLTLLQHLYLACNALGPAGLQALLPGVQQLVDLRCLELQFNALDKEGAVAFAAGLHQLSGLGELDLKGNKLGGECEQVLAHIIRTSSPGCKVSCQ